MKRCIKCLIGWIILRFEWKQIVGFGVAGLLGIAIAILYVASIDKVPATPSDYEQLESEMNIIQQNLDLLEIEHSIDPRSGSITIIIENAECKLITQYNKNFEVLSTSREDKYMSWGVVLLCALIIVFLITYMGGYTLELILMVLEPVADCILKRIKKAKAKFQKE